LSWYAGVGSGLELSSDGGDPDSSSSDDQQCASVLLVIGCDCGFPDDRGAVAPDVARLFCDWALVVVVVDDARENQDVLLGMMLNVKRHVCVDGMTF
jgi:hypothetical protein